MSSAGLERPLFETLGFQWDRSELPTDFPVHPLRRVAFRLERMLPEFVWDASTLEGNPFTYPEVKTLLDGITVGGRKVSDHQQVLNLAASAKQLLNLVRLNQFRTDKPTFASLHALVARDEALEWGHFRGEGEETSYTPNVGLGVHGAYTPLATSKGAPELNLVFTNAVRQMERDLHNPFEKAAAFFLFGALQQFYFDGNKRTSRLMMNGILLSAGIDAISVPAAKAQEFNEKMVQFYVTKDASEMMCFLVDCHPDAAQLHRPSTAESPSGPLPESDKP